MNRREEMKPEGALRQPGIGRPSTDQMALPQLQTVLHEEKITSRVVINERDRTDATKPEECTNPDQYSPKEHQTPGA
jgi:hypothetical protein